MAVFLRHNPHRVRSFIAGSFAQLHRVLEKDEAAALALTYFRALARSVESELEEWLTMRGLHPAKVSGNWRSGRFLVTTRKFCWCSNVLSSGQFDVHLKLECSYVPE